MPVDLEEIERWFRIATSYANTNDQEASDAYLCRIGEKTNQIATEIRALRARVAELEAQNIEIKADHSMLLAEMDAESFIRSNLVRQLSLLTALRPMETAPHEEQVLLWYAPRRTDHKGCWRVGVASWGKLYASGVSNRCMATADGWLPLPPQGESP